MENSHIEEILKNSEVVTGYVIKDRKDSDNDNEYKILEYVTKDNKKENLKIRNIKDVEDIVSCEEVLYKLNEKIRKYQDSSVIKVIVRYRITLGDTDEIKDWGYEWVDIGLRVGVIRELKEIWSMIEEKIDYEYYNKGIRDIVREMESMVLHRALGVRLRSKEIIEELKRNKISRRDLIRYLSKKMGGGSGVVKIKTVTSLEDIGYIMILNWDVNYDTWEIEVDIEGDKILNVDEGEYIVDEDIVRVFKSILGIGPVMKLGMLGEKGE